jgi:hypothetical protein
MANGKSIPRLGVDLSRPRPNYPLEAHQGNASVGVSGPRSPQNFDVKPSADNARTNAELAANGSARMSNKAGPIVASGATGFPSEG